VHAAISVIHCGRIRRSLLFGVGTPLAKAMPRDLSPVLLARTRQLIS